MVCSFRDADCTPATTGTFGPPSDQVGKAEMGAGHAAVNDGCRADIDADIDADIPADYVAVTSRGRTNRLIPQPDPTANPRRQPPSVL